MATFESTRYPHLTLQDGTGIWARFEDGRFDTADAAVVKRLRALPEEEGISEVKSSEKAGRPPEAKAPAKSASKEDWVTWAVACGADPLQATAASRDELAEQYAGTTPQQ